MLAKAFNAIKRPMEIRLYQRSVAPTGYWAFAGKSDNGWDDDVYYAGMAAAGAGQYMDCVGVHYNEGIVAPSQGAVTTRQLSTRYFSSMLSRAVGPFGGKPACFTELGY